MKKDILNISKAIVLGLVLSVGVGYISAEWNEPLVPATAGNTNAPLNTGAGTQEKGTASAAGHLTLFGRLTASFFTLLDGTPGDDAGKILVSDANGNASWDTLSTFGSGSFAFKRSTAQVNDSVIWCPVSHPHMVTCNIVDDQALPANSLTDLQNPCGISGDGSCSLGASRGNLGSDDMYLERVKNSSSQYGCVAYDYGHSHAAYKLDLLCSK